MNTAKKAKLLALFVALLVVISVVPGVLPYVRAQAVDNDSIKVTDGNNDGVFFVGENITIEWSQNAPAADPGVGIYGYNSASNNYTRVLNTTGDYIGKEVINGITYYKYKATLTLNESLIPYITNPLYPLHIYINASGATLPDNLTVDDRNYDLYVNYIKNVAVKSVYANTTVGNDTILLLHDKLFVNATIFNMTDVSGANLTLTLGQLSVQMTVTGNNSQATLNLSKVVYQKNLTIKAGRYIVKTVLTNLSVYKPHLEYLPVRENSTNVPLINAANYTFNSTVNASNVSYAYKLSIKLTGATWNHIGCLTKLDDHTLVIPDASSSALNIGNLTNTTINVPDGTKSITVTILFNGTDTIITKDTLDVLAKNQNATLSVKPDSTVKGEAVTINIAITKVYNQYNYTVKVYPADNATWSLTFDNGSNLNKGKYINLVWNTTTNWTSGWPVGEYVVELFVCNSSNITQNFTLTKNVTVKEEITSLTFEPSDYYMNQYYPNDTVVFYGEFLRTDANSTTFNVIVYNETNNRTTISAQNMNVNATAKTFNFTIKFPEPGTYTVVVNESDVSGVKKNVSIKIAKYIVEPNETSATIPLGTSYTIQVKTTSNGSLIVQIPSAAQYIGWSNVTDKPFNSTTHLKVFNVTFTTNGTTKLGSWPINITVTNGKKKQFTLTVTDDITPLYVQKKVVLHSKAFVQIKTTANLTSNEYNIKVWAFGVNPTDAPNLTKNLSIYNATELYRIINMTFDVTNAIYSKDPEKYPTHYMNITDGHKWVKETFEIVEDPELHIKPVDTAVVGQNVTFEGTTLLGPGDVVTVNISKIDPQNASNVLWCSTSTATVVLDTSRDENTFKFSFKFNETGLFNVTVNWSTYKYTIQVNVMGEGVLGIETPKDSYYPKGILPITVKLDNVTETNAVNVTLYWMGGSAGPFQVNLTNGTGTYYFNMSAYTIPAGTLRIEATYHNQANATKEITILEEPSITNLTLEKLEDVTVNGTTMKGVKLGKGLFNITADTNLGLNATVTAKILNATKATVDSWTTLVKDDGSIRTLVNMTNTIKYPVGKYYIVLEYGNVNVTSPVYVWETEANISVKNATFDVPENKVVNFTVPVNVTLENTGDLDGNHTVEVYLDDEVANSTTVTVKAGEEKSVLLNVKITEPGDHTIKVDGFNTTFKALAPAEVSVVNLAVEPREGVGSFTISINVTLENTGDVDAKNYSVTVYVNDTKLTKNVTVPAHNTTVVTFTYKIPGPGEYIVKAGEFNKTVTALAPAEFVLSNFTVEPTEGVAPFNITASVIVKNTGDVAGNYTAVLYVDGEAVANKTVEVPAGGSALIEMTYEFTADMAGVHNVTIDSLEPKVVVVKKAKVEIEDYKKKVQEAKHVYVAYGSGALSSDSFAISAYISKTVPSEKFFMREDTQVNMSKLTEEDIVIAVGGPAVNKITAIYEDIAPVHMIVGENITIVTPEGNLTWSAPKVWYNVTEGYFIIQLFKDNETGALVVTIYGTDADSTLAGAYYFANTIYPNIDNYTGVSWIVGKWTDSNPGEPVVILNPADTSGFNPADTIKVVYEG